MRYFTKNFPLLLLLLLLGVIPRIGHAEEDKYVAPIYPVASPITIDGNITEQEWGGDRLAWPIEIEEYGTLATYWLRYDRENLYGAFKVTDSSPAKNTRLMSDRWEGDQIELCLGTDPANQAKHDHYGEYDFQIFAGKDGEGTVNAYVNINPKQSGAILPGSRVAVQMWPDGKGYNLEFALPWASLNKPADFQPAAGVKIGWQIQIDFSTPDGDRFAYAAKWWPHGLHFQNPSSWAWAQFLAPGEELLAPRHTEAASARSGSEVQFPTPEDGLVSVNITDDKGVPIRRLVIGKQLKKGTNAALWDGKDDAGHAVPPGVYQLRGSVANLHARYLTTLDNTSPEPYGGCRKSSGGEYRHGCWSHVIMNPDGTFYILNWGGEGPPSIQQIDPKAQFRPIWGGTTSTSGNEFQEYGCRDGNMLYFTHNKQADPAVKGGKARRISILSRMDATTHKGVRFSSGDWNVALGEPHENVDLRAETADVRGLGAFQGKVYVPCFYENRLDIYDGASGAKLGTISQPAFNGPADVAFNADGVMYVVDTTAVHVFDQAGAYKGQLITGLSRGVAVAVGPEGKLYVADEGSNQVKIFSAQGKLLKTMGPQGGATVTLGKSAGDSVGGKIADDWFYHPEGVAVDAAGNLVVVDTGNVRVQYFNAAGKCLKSIQAEMYAGLSVDPRHPDTVYVTGAANVMLEYQMNWETGASRLIGEYAPTPGAGTVRFAHGQPYFFAGPNMVWTLEKGRPRVSSTMDGPRYPSYEVPLSVVENGKVVTKNYQALSPYKEPISKPYEYRDTNGDGLPQLSEYHFYSAEESKLFWGYRYDESYVDDDWNIYYVARNWQSGHWYIVEVPFQGFDKGRNPIYSWTKAEMKLDCNADPAWNAEKFGALTIGGMHVGPDGAIYLVVMDRPGYDPQELRVRKYSADGKREWDICHITHGFWHKPGEEISFCTDMAGMVDNLVFLTGVTGAFDVFNPDGLYAGTLLEPGDISPDMKGTDSRYQPEGEQWNAHVFRHPKTGKVYLISQPNAEPLILLYEVTGTNTVKYFSGSCRLGGE